MLSRFSLGSWLLTMHDKSSGKISRELAKETVGLLNGACIFEAGAG